MRLSIKSLAIPLVLMAALAAPALAQTGGAGEDKVDTIRAIIDLLREKKVISNEEASEFMTRLAGRVQTGRQKVILERTDVGEAAQPAAPGSGGPIAIIQGKPSSSGAWTERVRWGGDIRVRYQGDYFDEANAYPLVNTSQSPGNREVLNTTEDRNRMRVRARIKAEAIINEYAEAGVRLATGDSSSAVSTNDTLGDNFAKDDAWIDLAYVKLMPNRNTSIWTGRMPNPFFSTDLVWDSDVSMEGVAVQASYPVTKSIKPFVNAGAFPIKEVEESTHDKWLYAGQVGVEVKPYTDLTTKLGVAYYDYRNIAGQANTAASPNLYDYTAAGGLQKGNTLFSMTPSVSATDSELGLLSDYNILNVTAQVTYSGFTPVDISLVGDYARNFGWNWGDIEERTGVDRIEYETRAASVEPQLEAWQAGVIVGYKEMKEFGDWKVSAFYKYLEADAVLDAFTDSDFHAGGTNAKGYILRGELGILQDIWLALQYMSSDEVVGPYMSIDTLQMDLNARF